MRRTVIGLLLVTGAAGAAAHAARRGARAVELPSTDGQPGVFASEQALRLLSAGYPSLVADLFWLRAINYYGDNRNHPKGYPDLEPMLRRTLHLDPWFVDAYLFAGNSLTMNDLDPGPPQRLLEEGMRRRPDAWRLFFLHGFNAFYHEGDPAASARSLSAGAKIPGAHPTMNAMAANVAAAAGSPETGLQVLDAYLQDSGMNLASSEEEGGRQEYLELRLALVLEVGLRRLQQAVDEHRRRHGGPPASLEALVTSGLVAALPEDPFGGRFFLEPDGRVASTSEAERAVFTTREGWRQTHKDSQRAQRQAQKRAAGAPP